MLNEVVSYIEQCLETFILNPPYKPASVSPFVLAGHPLDFTSSFLPFFPRIPPRLASSPSRSLCSFSSFPIVELPRHYIATFPSPSSPPLGTSLSSPVSRLRSYCAPSKEQHRASTAIFFGHHNTLLRKLIILIVGIPRVIFGSTTHFIH